MDKEPGVEVWRSDGTEPGTTRVLDLPSLDLQTFALADGPLFLHGRVAGLPQNHEMWAVDVATGGAVRFLQVVTSLDDLTMSAAGPGSGSRRGSDQVVRPRPSARSLASPGRSV